MLHIHSFACKLSETNRLAEWLRIVGPQVKEVPYHKLRFMVHEAFVNAVKFSEFPDHEIVVMLRNLDESLEIIVTDTGRGFKLPELKDETHQTWPLAKHDEVQILAEIKNTNTLSFSLNEPNTPVQVGLLEHHRGLLSILRLAKQMTYHFSKSSFNYLRIDF